MARVFLSLGSNLGDRRQHLEAALARLRAEMGIRVITCSQVYETTPWPELGSPRETWHLNCAVEIETDLPPHRLLRLTQAIESQSGRPQTAAVPPAPASPRPLDIDILLYADQVIAEDRLQIPHPFLHLRRFVLVPLADIAPDFEHPTLYQSILDLLGELPGDGDVLPYPG
jgi:2-amino-4-hydroxy-6-hydroxymethyldihydropteridine diphosphokinase